MTITIKKNRLSRALGIAGFAALGALALAVFFIDPGKIPLPLCALRNLTGLYCPGCGATRALHALMHLNIAGAFAQNALMAPLLPVLAYMTVAELLRVVAGRPLLPQLPLNPWVVGAVGVLFFLFGVLRNLPAFAFLAPG